MLRKARVMCSFGSSTDIGKMTLQSLLSNASTIVLYLGSYTGLLEELGQEKVG